MGPLDVLLVVINHNISFTGKTWLLMVGFRLFVVLLAGFTLFSDEQERFICNTIQPGCSNVCFDLFTPVSLFRLWLLHILLLCLPHLVFAAHVAHKVLWNQNVGTVNRGSSCSMPEVSLGEAARRGLPCVWSVPSFHGAYLLAVILRLLLETACAAGQFLFFGLFIPRSFLCHEAPCTSGVECYVSRPTEKTLMLDFMLGLACLSVLLCLFDLVSSTRRALRWRKKTEVFLKEMSKGEQGSLLSNVSSAEECNLLTRRKIADESIDAKDGEAMPGNAPDVGVNGGINGKAGDPIGEKKLQYNHGNEERAHSAAPRATSLLGQFVLHSQQKPPGSASPASFETFTPAGSRNQGQQTCMGPGSRQNSTSRDTTDKRAWV